MSRLSSVTFFFFFSSRRRHTRWPRDWSSDVCSSDLAQPAGSAFATAGNQEMVILFAAGNDGPGPGTIGSPGTAKNIISVGASENVRSEERRVGKEGRGRWALER